MAVIIFHHRQFSPHVMLSFLAATALIGATTAAVLREQPLLLTVSFAAFAIVALCSTFYRPSPSKSARNISPGTLPVAYGGGT
jgi:hypothetical protein